MPFSHILNSRFSPPDISAQAIADTSANVMPASLALPEDHFTKGRHGISRGAFRFFAPSCSFRSDWRPRTRHSATFRFSYTGMAGTSFPPVTRAGENRRLNATALPRSTPEPLSRRPTRSVFCRDLSMRPPGFPSLPSRHLPWRAAALARKALSTAATRHSFRHRRGVVQSRTPPASRLAITAHTAAGCICPDAMSLFVHPQQQAPRHRPHPLRPPEVSIPGCRFRPPNQTGAASPR